MEVGTVHYKSDKTVNFCGFSCVARSPITVFYELRFLPRCMECRRGLAMRILSVRLSVCHTREL